jgi:outer membrane immunogenic protein
MKKLLLAAAALISLAGGHPAGAADLGVRAAAPPPVAPVYNWSGLYVGAGWGYGMSNLDTRFTSVGLPFSFNQTLGGRGWLGTVTVGGDYQLNNWLVLGGFADYDWANIKGNGQNQAPFAVIGPMNEKAAWAVGARAGWAMTPAILTYVSAGYTQARFTDASGTIPSHTYSGWFIGSGVETRLSGFLGIFGPGWFWHNEYRFADYHSTALSSGPLLTTVSVHPFVQTVRSELLYKFNWSQ